MLGDVFVLHGGTALNVFHDRASRLSVDIDLMFVGAADAESMRAMRPKVSGWNSGGKGYTYWRNGQQGHFSFVDYNGFALQNVYPWNEMTSYKDGSIKWAQG